MNGSDACDSLINTVNWSDAASLLVLAVLLLINVMVVVGNCLVIAAVYMSSKLRTVTNLFIVSLAVADLMVGVAVLPFSATWEVFKVWIFGDLWCSIWLAVDVWMCTASILNLCAISLDRYVAVTRPVNYPSIMSSSRAKLLIAGVWILSFVICFPPLVGWKDSDRPLPPPPPHRIRHPHPMLLNHRPSPPSPSPASPPARPPLDNLTDLLPPNATDFPDYPYPHPRPPRTAPLPGVPVLPANLFHFPAHDYLTHPSLTPSPAPPEPPPCPWTCELTSDTGYVIYSALGSFFIPMGVMLFFYWRIYRAAVQTTRAINQGFRTTKGSGAFGNRFDEQRLTLRIHRGRGSVQNHSSASSSATTCGSPSANSTYGRSPESHTLTRARSTKTGKPHDKIKISVSYPSSDQISSALLNNNAIPPPPPSPTPSTKTPNHPLINPSPEHKNYLSISPFPSPKKTLYLPSPPSKNFFHNHFSKHSPPHDLYAVHYSTKPPPTHPHPHPHLSPSPTPAPAPTLRSLSIDSTSSALDDDHPSRRNSARPHPDDPSPTAPFDDPHKPRLVSKMAKRNIKTQVKRFRMETKAAKTLGIIVGGFVLCWMPFFTIYLVRAFCPLCVNPVVFSVLFWLGYCNSAINPCIYALFSKDFRFAFKKIICRFLCGPEKRLSVRLRRRGSDGSQARGPGRQRSPSYAPPNSVGEDSDPGGSESR